VWTFGVVVDTPILDDDLRFAETVENFSIQTFIPEFAGTPQQGLGRSKGGFTTKIHLRVNAMGLPIAIALTGGEVFDYKGYMSGMDAKALHLRCYWSMKATMPISFATTCKAAADLL
jgi:hypothetical protein